MIWTWFPASKEPGYRFLHAWGAYGKGPAEFRQPIGIAIAGNEIFVSDAGNNRIQVFDRNGQFIRRFGHEGTSLGELSRPMHMDIRDNKLYVAEYLNDRIQVFGPDGRFLRKWGGPLAINIPGSAHGWFKTATAVTVGPQGNILVADFYNHRIQKFTPDGKFLVAFGSWGTGPGQFDRPTDVAIDVDGNVYVVDFGNNRIQKFARIQ